MNKQALKQLLKPLFFLTVLIIVCGFLVRILTDSETLSDYAAKNPELAYGTNEENIDNNEKKDIGESGSMEETNQIEAENNTISENESLSKTDVPSNTESISDTKTSIQPNDIENISPDRIVYQKGFYYEPLTESVKKEISGISYPISAKEASASTIPALNMLKEDETPAVSYDELRYLSVLHYDFNGEVQTGELICNQGIAKDLAEIFYELYLNEYRIEKIRLIDEYQGDDTASMEDNNTSCFNYRVVDGTTSLSKHALGCAIDINPFYNPYVVFNKDGSGETYISPAGSEIYADRSKDFPYKIDENDLCYKLFTEHGFVWGGHWNSCKDYQHFQKVVE